MKKQFLLFAGLCLMSLFGNAQTTNLVIFSEDSEPFYAFVNGVKQNGHAETNVKLTGITPNISLRIEFENKALPKLTKTMSLEPGFEHTARIKKDKKTQALKLQYFGQVPIAESTAGAIPTVEYHTAEDAAATTGSATDNSHNGNNSVTSTTTTTQVGNTESVAVNMNMAGVGITMVTPAMTTTMQTTTSSTVTQSSSSTGSTFSDEQHSTQTTTAAAPARTGCGTAMSTSNFAKMKQSVESKPFSDTKMSTAKVATKNACLSVAQIKEITKLFSMDDDKLAYAKYAYDYCVDKANYYQVSEVFSFSSTTDEFNKFLEK